MRCRKAGKSLGMRLISQNLLNRLPVIESNASKVHVLDCGGVTTKMFTACNWAIPSSTTNAWAADTLKESQEACCCFCYNQCKVSHVIGTIAERTHSLPINEYILSLLLSTEKAWKAAAQQAKIIMPYYIKQSVFSKFHTFL